MSGHVLNISLRSEAGRAWPDGKPLKSELQSEGMIRHSLADGRVLLVSEPEYRLEYVSTWVGAEPGETYDVNIGIVGLSSREGFYEAWNFDIGEVRNYSFAKSERIVHLRTGEVFTGDELRKSLTAQTSPSAHNAAS